MKRRVKFTSIKSYRSNRALDNVTKRLSDMFEMHESEIIREAISKMGMSHGVHADPYGLNTL